MARIVAFTTQKGGVGKTTICLSTRAALLKRGFRVLTVDLDPQGNLTYASGVDEFSASVLDVLQKRTTLHDAILNDILASSPFLSSADIMFNSIGKEYILREALSPIRKEYDFILLDCPPSLGILSVNALCCADCVVIPAQADIFSVQGILQLGENIDAVRRYINPDLKISGILLNRYNARSIISRNIKDMLDSVAQQLGTVVCNTVIRECSALKEAMALRTDIFTHAGRSNAAIDFNTWADEFFEKVKGGQ